MSRGCLASECLTMAILYPSGTLIWHPSSQAEACAAVSFALAFREILDACRAGLLYVAPVFSFTCVLPHMPDFAVSVSSTFISAPSLVIPPCMLTLPAFTCKRSDPPLPHVWQQVCLICPRFMICCSVCIHLDFAV